MILLLKVSFHIRCYLNRLCTNSIYSQRRFSWPFKIKDYNKEFKKVVFEQIKQIFEDQKFNFFNFLSYLYSFLRKES